MDPVPGDVKMTQSGFLSLFMEAWQRVPDGERAGISVEKVYTVSHLETGGGNGRPFQRSMNLYSIHAGEPDPKQPGSGVYIMHPKNEFWDGRYYDTQDPKNKANERLRVYKSLTDSIRDFLRLLRGSRYTRSRALLYSGSAQAFFQALHEDGFNPFASYPRELARVYNEVVV